MFSEVALSSKFWFVAIFVPATSCVFIWTRSFEEQSKNVKKVECSERIFEGLALSQIPTHPKRNIHFRNSSIVEFRFFSAGVGAPVSVCRTNNRARATETTRFRPSWARPKSFSDPLLFETFASNLYSSVVMMTMMLLTTNERSLELKFKFEKRSPASQTDFLNSNPSMM